MSDLDSEQREEVAKYVGVLLDRNRLKSSKPSVSVQIGSLKAIVSVVVRFEIDNDISNL